MTMKYSRIVAEFYGRVWAIREETLLAMQELLRLQSAGVKWSTEEIRERIAAANAASGFTGHQSEARYIVAQDKFDDAQENLPMIGASGKRNSAGAGSVAVIPMMGTISHRMSMMSEVSGGGGASTQQLTANFRQALADTNCKAIVFDVDSPGGSVEGVIELASEIYNARKQKPIVAVCNSMAASAAYWLASAAGEVVCTPSGQCGSIGVFMLVQDVSEALKNEGVTINLIKAGKYKAEGHPTQPLTDEARAFLQSQVDSMYSTFVKTVAQQRGASQTAVRDGYGQGRTLYAADAVKAGLADRVATLDDVLAKFGIKTSANPRQIAASEGGDLTPAAKLPKDDEPDEDDLCECKCEDCVAGHHGAQCSDDMCADPNCGHLARAALTTPALTAEEEKTQIEAAAGECLRAMARRRRQLSLH